MQVPKPFPILGVTAKYGTVTSNSMPYSIDVNLSEDFDDFLFSFNIDDTSFDKNKLFLDGGSNWGFSTKKNIIGNTYSYGVCFAINPSTGQPYMPRKPLEKIRCYYNINGEYVLFLTVNITDSDYN